MDIGIAGMGFYVPSGVRSNSAVAEEIRRAMAENSEYPEKTKKRWQQLGEEEIVGISGIQERRVADKDELTSDMGAKAAKKALDDALASPEEIDALLVATMTRDCVTPSTACYIQEKVGLRNLKMLPGDFNGACAGMVGCMRMAKSLIKDEDDSCQTALIVGVEKTSSLINPRKPESYILFGDGAAAVVLKADSPKMKLLGFSGGGDGSKTEIIKADANGALQFLGTGIFKFAIQKMPELTRELMEMHGKNIGDLSLLIPHQANLRIIEAARERIGLPREKVFVNVDKYGNTSAPSAVIALCEAREQGMLRKGDLVAVVMFGAGVVFEGCLIEV